MRGAHFPAPLQRPLLRSIGRCCGKRLSPQAVGLSSQIACRARHIQCMMTVACSIRRRSPEFPCGVLGFFFRFLPWTRRLGGDSGQGQTRATIRGHHHRAGCGDCSQPDGGIKRFLGQFSGLNDDVPPVSLPHLPSTALAGYACLQESRRTGNPPWMRPLAPELLA